MRAQSRGQYGILQSMIRTGGQGLVGQLVREGVREVFGIPGVQLDWAVEALREAQDDIRFIVPRHEQAASYMADGYARTTGREGVCMVVPGPGVLNALSGLATAWACNSRLLFLAGQIPSPTIGRGYGMLHEIADQSGILRSLTKWHALARTPEDVPGLVHEAFAQLRSGRPRPVALELPPDVLQGPADMDFLAAAETVHAPIDRIALERAAALLRAARYPVLFAGGGVAATGAGDVLRELAERLQAPVVMTDGARGVLSDRHPLALTTLGGRAVLPHADVVLVAGSRFLTAVAAPVCARPDCQFIYLNVEPSDMGAPRLAGLAIEGDAALGLAALADLVAGVAKRPSREGELVRVRQWCLKQQREICPQADYVDALRAALPEDGILVSELTQVGYFANLAFPVHAPRSLLTPGYQGTLGYGYPTALGAAVGNPGRPVVSITGDGGFGWALQELATAARYGLNVAVVVFADGRYGNVRRTFGQEFATEIYNPNFQALAAAFGVRAARAESPDALRTTLASVLAEGGPSLIEVPVGEMASPWPLIHPFVPHTTPPPPNPLGEPGRMRGDR